MSSFDVKVAEISIEFQLKIKEIFESNLVFGFIYGGLAKGYGLTRDHDIDMLVCLKNLDQSQIDRFREFYYNIHEKYEYTADTELSWDAKISNAPREFVTFTEILDILNRMNDLKISLIIKYFKEYEAIVVCDIFAGQVIAKTGDVKMLELVQSYCEKFPSEWRKEIINKLDKYTIETEMHLIEKLNITRVFRRYVTYLKKYDDKLKCLNVCILGGGGNVAEAVIGKLLANGHSVSQFRFATQKVIPGVPQRPPRSMDRIKEIKFIQVNGEENESLVSKEIETITSVDYEFFHKFDVFIYAYPSYMTESVANELGKHLIGKPLVNLSDRFLGSYSLVKHMQRLYGQTPIVCAAFNGVPIMALKDKRENPTTVYYVKPKHSVSWYPQTRDGRTQAISLLLDLFGFSADCLIPYPNMLHLALENTHCIEHAVVDLYNLKKENYSDTSNKLYSETLYKNECISRIESIVNERNKISQKLVGRIFYSLKDYDVKVFGINSQSTNLADAGTEKYRIQHKYLSQAPNLSKTTAFGYEDIGWSMVTLESLAKAFSIESPELSALIDEWNQYMNEDYRKVGRTIEKLDLIKHVNGAASLKDYRDLNWNSDFMTEEAKNAILNNS